MSCPGLHLNLKFCCKSQHQKGVTKEGNTATTLVVCETRSNSIDGWKHFFHFAPSSKSFEFAKHLSHRSADSQCAQTSPLRGYHSKLVEREEILFRMKIRSALDFYEDFSSRHVQSNRATNILQLDMAF